MLRRLLVANRGEIAVRVFRAARELGIETVGVYSAADARAAHLEACDRAEALDGQDPRAAYLDIDAVLAAARRAGADSVHPGYGFLSENPEFARRVDAQGLAFVGPLPETMEAFGVKTKARALVGEAGVPTVPGTLSPVRSAEEAASEADRVGYPVLLKASYGGGGRGIRKVESSEAMADAFESAAGEARLAFGNGELYVEKFFESPRHIEVQVAGDGRGGAVHFFERDCSMQRRHQKLLEETPAPNLPEELRARLLADAVSVARAGRYRSAGTVEFLVVAGRHYFLEVNARLQVEHPVTEVATGVDLVKLQLTLAGGEGALPSQDEVALRGHAVECRINAEDTRSNFIPVPGTIGRFQPPSGPGVRVDGAAAPGSEVSPHYDSLLAKLIVHAESRPLAIARARRALDEFTVTGVPTTIPFHRRALAWPAFVAGDYSTSTVAEMMPLRPAGADEIDAVAAAGALFAWMGPAAGARRSLPAGPRAPRPGAMRPPFGPRGRGWFHEL